MEISREDIDELVRIHKEENGEELSETEARDMARRLLWLYRLLYSNLPEEGTNANKSEATWHPESKGTDNETSDL